MPISSSDCDNFPCCCCYNSSSSDLEENKCCDCCCEVCKDWCNDESCVKCCTFGYCCGLFSYSTRHNTSPKVNHSNTSTHHYDQQPQSHYGFIEYYPQPQQNQQCNPYSYSGHMY